MSFESSSDDGPENASDNGILYGCSPPPPATDFGGRLGKKRRRAQEEMTAKSAQLFAKKENSRLKTELSFESSDRVNIDTPSSEDSEYVTIKYVKSGLYVIVPLIDEFLQDVFSFSSGREEAYTDRLRQFRRRLGIYYLQGVQDVV